MLTLLFWRSIFLWEALSLGGMGRVFFLTLGTNDILCLVFIFADIWITEHKTSLVTKFKKNLTYQKSMKCHNYY